AIGVVAGDRKAICSGTSGHHNLPVGLDGHGIGLVRSSATKVSRYHAVAVECGIQVAVGVVASHAKQTPSSSNHHYPPIGLYSDLVGAGVNTTGEKIRDSTAASAKCGIQTAIGVIACQSKAVVLSGSLVEFFSYCENFVIALDSCGKGSRKARL